MENCLYIVSVVFLLCSVSHTFRYYGRFIIFVVLCTITTITMLPLAMLRPRNISNAFYVTWTGPIISRILGIETEVRGKENISTDESYIVMVNHQSILDILGMSYSWPLLKKCTAVMKEEIFYVWPYGLFLWLCGIIFIPRSNGKKSIEILNKDLQIRKKNKVSLWIYPEGTRSTNGQLRKFKKGGFHMALSAQIPILPIVTSRYNFLDNKNKHFNKGKIIMTVLPPISTEGKTLENMDSLMKEVHEKMKSCFERISIESLNPHTY